MLIYDPGIDRNDSDLPAPATPVKTLRLVPVDSAPVETVAPVKAHPTRFQQILYTWDMFARSLRFGDDTLDWLGIAGGKRDITEHEWLALLYKDDQAAFLDMRNSLALKPTPFALNYRVTAPNGRTYTVSQKGMPYPGNEDSGNWVGVMDMEETPLSLNTSIPAGEAPAASPADETVFDYSLRFVRELRLAIEQAKEKNSQGALFILSINNLAMIINAYGHDASELALKELEAEIRKVLMPEDRIERIHRDQFAIIVPSCRKEEIESIVQQVQRAIRAYGASSSFGAMHVTNTIGSVDFPGSASNAVEAIDRAYMALNSAHDGHYKSYITSQNEMQASRQEMGLANHLRKAIHENRLRLAFQPVIESKTGRIAHYEALLRIIGADGKISSAGPLIPIAEKMNLIDMVDHLVLEMVMKELLNSPNVTLALNVSNLTTDSREWLKKVTAYLREHPAVASRMIIEITETAAQRDLRQTSYFVASMQALGCRVALDDFGSGYTSFRQLKALSVDMVKIDGMFIRDLTTNPDNRFFVKTLLDFVNGFGLEAVAEYVEHGETAKMLMEMGVHMMQGYYFGKPENYRSWLNQGEYKK